MNHSRSRHGPVVRGQRGATLLVGLIILLLLTLHAIAAFHSSTSQLRIVGNMQERQAIEAAANQALGQALDTSIFATDPSAVAARPVLVDLDGDGAPDFIVTLAPTCMAVKPLSGKDFDPDADDNFGCVSGTALGTTSLCALTQWDLQASAVPVSTVAQTGAAIEVHQGAAVRMTTSEAMTGC